MDKLKDFRWYLNVREKELTKACTTEHEARTIIYADRIEQYKNQIHLATNCIKIYQTLQEKQNEN